MPRHLGIRNTRPTLDISRLRFALAFLAVVLLGAWARLRGFPSVLTENGAELLPADSHYYVRFALLQLESFPRFTTFDPLVNHPTGATITWPPGHAFLVALAVLLGGRETPELGAAFVGPVVGTLWLVVVGWLAWRCRGERADGRGHGDVAALSITALLAFLPVVVESAAIGNADHHVHEPMLLAALVLLFGRLVSRTTTTDPAGNDGPIAPQTTTKQAIVAGALLGIGRLFTLSAFIYVPLMAAVLLLATLLAVDRESRNELARVTLIVGLTCASVLGASVLLWGVNAFFYEQLSWFHPLFALATFLGAAGIAAMASRRIAFGGGLIVAGIALMTPVLSDVLRAGGHLGRQDPLLARVIESTPLLSDPAWAFQLLGIGLPLLFLALGWAIVEALRRRDVALLPALVAATLTAIAAAAQARFAQSLGGALAVIGGMAIASLLPLLQKRPTRSVAFGAVAMGVLTLAPMPWPETPREPDPEVALVRPMLRWMQANAPRDGDDGVVADYLLGHYITLWAQRPAVATTFSQSPTHVAGNARASAVLAAPSDEIGWERMQETGGRYLLVAPLPVLGVDADASRNGLAAWLHRTAGMEGTWAVEEEREATSHFRLWRDAPERRDDGSLYARLFEAVPGATITGHATPGSAVVATLALRTNLGDGLHYVRRTTADEDGRFELRVAYSTNAVHPVASEGAYELVIDDRRVSVLVPESAVYGATIAVH